MFYMELRRLIFEQKYNDALGVIEKFECLGCVTPEIYVWKAICIQMSGDVEDGYELADVRTSLHKAIEMDGLCIDAHIEFGHFLYAVEDNAEEAVIWFGKAADLSRDKLKDSANGVRKCNAWLSKWKQRDKGAE